MAEQYNNPLNQERSAAEMLKVIQEKEEARKRAEEAERIRAEAAREKAERDRLASLAAEKKRKAAVATRIIVLVTSIVCALMAIVFMFLGSRVFAILTVISSIIAGVSGFVSVGLSNYDYEYAPFIMVATALVTLVVGCFQWFGIYGVSGDMLIKDGVLKYNYILDEEIIEVPDGVTEIGGGAFCRGFSGDDMKCVILPDGVKTIGSGAFSTCGNLESINFPEGLETIGSRAFRYCDALGKIVLPDSLKTIEAEAFEGCSGLEEVHIGSGIEEIQSRAFRNCESLKTVYFNGTEEEWNNVVKEEGKSAWDKGAGDYEIVFLK